MNTNTRSIARNYFFLMIFMRIKQILIAIDIAFYKPDDVVWYMTS